MSILPASLMTIDIHCLGGQCVHNNDCLFSLPIEDVDFGVTEESPACPPEASTPQISSTLPKMESANLPSSPTSLSSTINTETFCTLRVWAACKFSKKCWPNSGTQRQQVLRIKEDTLEANGYKDELAEFRLWNQLDVNLRNVFLSFEDSNLQLLNVALYK
ncbi:hypothetical protein AB205_0204910 [Aquarana catesbeiana]|uniref:Uncharacterized protein n=1 Tax=Aquarana catesbeiana TaxID=8400 RepID=A0A2G9RRZ4_AQUCT|nr:hypothetical protein AB205_0204910 [Aquarana catesbeiana]